MKNYKDAMVEIKQILARNSYEDSWSGGIIYDQGLGSEIEEWVRERENPRES